jgi:thymidylate synthase
MNGEENEYLELLGEILRHGSIRTDRTGIGTKSIFGSKLKFSLENNVVPMLTTKKVFFKGVVEELLFFLRGQTDTKILEAKGVNIWKGNTSREYLDGRKLNYLPEGDMGKGYGFQWRNFGGSTSGGGVDQLAQVLHTLRTDPTDRRIIISAWNPTQLPEIALAPCHIMVQFYEDHGKLSAQFYMRTVDTFLGLPFNILSYALLTRIVAQTVGMEAKELIFVGGDTHIYLNHLQQATEQISREPYPFPKVVINKKLSSIEDIEALQLSDFELQDYQSHAAIKAPMAV